MHIQTQLLRKWGNRYSHTVCGEQVLSLHSRRIYFQWYCGTEITLWKGSDCCMYGMSRWTFALVVEAANSSCCCFVFISRRQHFLRFKYEYHIWRILCCFMLYVMLILMSCDESEWLGQCRGHCDRRNMCDNHISHYPLEQSMIYVRKFAQIFSNSCKIKYLKIIIKFLGPRRCFGTLSQLFSLMES